MIFYPRAWLSRLKYSLHCSLLKVVQQPDDPKAWYLAPKPIFWAYAGGGQLCTYGNCKEAIENSIALGYNVLEIDVAVTSDGVPVLTHWFNPCGEDLYAGHRPTLKEFLAKPIAGKYTPWTLDDLLARMETYAGYVAFDPYFIYRSNWHFDLPRYLKEVVPADLRKRIIYQVPYLEEARRIQKGDFGFASLHYPLPNDIDQGGFWRLNYLVREILNAGVKSVSLCERKITDKTCAVIKVLRDAQVHVSIAGVDDENRVTCWMNTGADIFNSRVLCQGSHDEKTC